MISSSVPDVTDWITYLPEAMDPTRPTGLWYCHSIYDVDAVKINAFCLSITGEWDDLLHCTEFFKSFDYLFVAVPNPERRAEELEEIRRRVTCIPIIVAATNAFRGCESLPEYIAKYGRDNLPGLLSGAEEVLCSGLLNIADVHSKNRRAAVMSGISELDRAIGGFAYGELSVWTGKRGDGKSTLLGQLLLESVNQNQLVCAYSGELPDERFREWLLLQAAGPKNVQRQLFADSGREYYYVAELVQHLIDEWWNKMLFVFDLSSKRAHDEDNILDLFEYAVRAYRCRTFLVDNIMTARLSGNSDYYRAQSDFVGRLSEFAKRTSSHVHLVAHPRKTGRDTRVEADDVSGIGDITNYADNVLLVERLSDADAAANGCDAMVKILKNREYGVRAKIGLLFDEPSRRYSGRDGKGITRQFSWEYYEARKLEELPAEEPVPFEVTK